MSTGDSDGDTGRSRQVARALEPIYRTPSPNDPVRLYEGPLILSGHDPDVVVEGTGILSIDWLPVPQLRFSMDARHWPSFSTGTATFRIPSLSVEAPCDVNSIRVVSSPDSAKVGYGGAIDSVEVGRRGPLSTIRFHVANFGGRGTEVITDADGRGGWIGRQALQAQGWRVTLDWLGPMARPAGQRARDDYEITHVGELARVDGATFSVDDGRRLLDMLFWLLTFARGRWCGVLLPVGLDGDGRTVWKEWKVGKIHPQDPSERSRSWHLRYSDALREVFPGMLARWDDPDWKEVLRLGVDMYATANVQSTSEVSLIVAQAALELLAWVILVERRRVLSTGRYGKLRGSDTLRRLLATAGIPGSIPPALEALTQSVLTGSKRRAWIDGPHAVTDLRNVVVHPTRRRGELGQRALPWFDAARLSLWYVELIVLRLLGYEGRYMNRMTFTEERVPWVGQGLPALA